MPIYQLSENIVFPPVQGAEDGVVAIGGDLKPERLMMAYHSGIFPWYSDSEPIIWWSPDPRFVLFPENLNVSKSTERLIRKKTFQVTYNQDFEGVITNCKTIDRRNQKSTWITDEMRAAYIELYRLGHAKSIEVWREDELVGGMYGIDLGKVFCGESMFSRVSNASKIGLITFMRDFEQQGGLMLDCQVHSDHLASLGAEEINREEFLKYLL